MTFPSRTGVTAGVTAGSPPDGRSWRRRRRIVAGLVATGLAGTSLLTPGLAAAAVPAFPDNIVVFPNRDMVVLEGFESLVDKDVTFEVFRGTQLMGATTAKMPGGGAEFEVNHPGGVCWGAAAGQPQVTPDIQAGDKVSIKVDGAVIADVTVQDAAVDEPASLAGNVLTVKGHVGAGVNPNFLEQRVINPDLVGTDVNRRDIRALVGPDAPAPKGGYTSYITVTGNQAVATYTFATPATAQLAAGSGGERMMAWQEEDADGNRQGLTISEFGEPGGPGMGGCPAGPGSVGASTPGSAAAIRSADKTSMQVNWTAATPPPGAAAVTGYSIVALGPSGTGDQVQIGRRTAANGTQTTITGLDPAVATYAVEVRSITGAAPNQELSKAFTVAAPGNAGGSGQNGGDGTPPAVAISATAPVTFTNIQPGDQVYYTLDGSPASVADMPSETALLYKDPVAITAANTTFNWAAFDAEGNKQDGTATFGPATNQAPGVPTGVTATAGAEFATVNWAAPTATGASAITKYVVTATPPTGAPVVVEAGATLRTIQVRPLVGNTAYTITVAAANAQGTSAAAASTPASVTPTVNTVPRVSIGTSRWKAGDFRVTGTTSAPVGTLVQVRRTSATGPVIATGNAVAGAVAGSQDYSIRARNNAAPAANPGQIWVTVTVNGVIGSAGPFTTTNG